MDQVHETKSIDVLQFAYAFILRLMIQEIMRKLVRKRNRRMHEIPRELSFVTIPKKYDISY